MGEEKPVQIILRVPASLRKRIRVEAAEEDRSMSQVVVSALRMYFNAPKGQGPKRK